MSAQSQSRALNSKNSGQSQHDACADSVLCHAAAALSLSFVSVLQALLGEGAAGDDEEEEAEEEEINLHAAASDGECSSRTGIDGMGVSCNSYGLGRLVAGPLVGCSPSLRPS